MPPETPVPNTNDPFVLSPSKDVPQTPSPAARPSTTLRTNGVLRLDTRTESFEADFAALVDARREADEDVSAVVREILADVRKRGDAAVAERTLKFDGHDLEQTGWQVDRAAR